MVFRPPKFFYNSSFSSFFLKPFGFIFSLVTVFRRKIKTSYRSKFPVICCGNITLGGTGKTPTALWIGKNLKKQDKKIAYLTRGWKGTELGPLLVNPKKHTSFQVGDEALLLAKEALTIVSKNRKEGAKFAETLDIDILIMDDGFQNPSLYKDFTCLIFDGASGLGNASLFPAGPLRETLKSGLSLSNCALIIGKDRTKLKEKIQKIKENFPIFEGTLEPMPNDIDKKEAYIAFAGIGFPEKFFSTLKKSNFCVLEKKYFSDHYSYTSSDLIKLTTLANSLKAKLITTEKDFVRLPNAYKKEVLFLPITLEMKKEKKFLSLLKNL